MIFSMLKPGDAVFAPRQVPHTFARIGEENGRMLLMYQPAGTMEAFYQEVKRTAQWHPARF